ncbi:MAG: hypothetical protein PHT60_14980 [Acidiphilium sp.]|nr:hypothetical protein [Acidiphilium sp.]MDD4937066.1 hypothetical protein [Acidiphilium sp.]
MNPLAHPGQLLIPQPEPLNVTSFINDDPGTIYSKFHQHWFDLFYLDAFHIGDPAQQLTFTILDESPFEDAAQCWQVQVDDFTLRLVHFPVQNGFDTFGYQLLTTGPVGVDLRLTAPDLKTASQRVLSLRKSRVRRRSNSPQRMSFAEAADMIKSEKPLRRIARDAPWMYLTLPGRNPSVARMLRVIADPYMGTLREMKNGTLDVVFHAHRLVSFPVRDRNQGISEMNLLFRAVS